MKVSNWNHWPVVDAIYEKPTDTAELPTILTKHRELIARGMGRSYGDASLSTTIVDCTGLNRILSIDQENQLLCAEAGCTLDSILSAIVPLGFFLPVVPGTRFITIGGAIAADIHGKNHHKHGSFSQHLVWLELIDENGQMIRCSADTEPALFERSCGGMGITGIILRACIRIVSIDNAFIKYRNYRYDDLTSLIKAFDKHQETSYTVAWIDTLSPTTRAVLICGEHCPAVDLPKKYKSKVRSTGHRQRLNVPCYFPRFVLSHLSIRLFNQWYYLRHNTSKKDAFQHYEHFFFPLDSIGHWNRLYGRKGFLQYQFVVPLGDESQQAITEVLALCRKERQASFLSVLKVFGDANPRAIMGFPQKGITLAMDLKMNKRLLPLLNQLDNIVEAAGGKLYLAKDARMNIDFFNRTYRNKVESSYFVSGLSKRLGLNKERYNE